MVLGSYLMLATILTGSLVSAVKYSANVSDSGVYSKSAVATDAGVCSEIGVSILKQGGSAVDAAISSLLCVGVVNCHSTGIGGGGFMIVYHAATGEAHSLDYREVAPLAATYDMYKEKGQDASKSGGLSMAVPGEVRGLEMAWKRWGRLDWKQLFEPVVRLAREGFPVSSTISLAIDSVKHNLNSGEYPGLVKLLTTEDGQYLKEGDILRRPLYADTLEKIANEGADYFYKSDFTKEMVDELKQEYGCIVTEEDFKQYQAVERSVTTASYKGGRVFGISPPNSGAVLGLILNILDNYDFNPEDFGNISYQRIVEAFKFAYAQRLKLGDPSFNDTIDKATKLMLDLDAAKKMFFRITDNETHDPDYYMWPHSQRGNVAHDHGTSHLSVLAENGDAVACTSTINLEFGSLLRSQKSGVIFNDEMDDFSYPSRSGSGNYKQTEVNYIQPGKRALSSTTPTIITGRDGDVKMVIGASGGFKITTAVAQVILNVLGFGKSLEDSIKLRRLHHQLFPNYISVERNFSDETQQSLRCKGHKIVLSSSHAVVQGILVRDKKVYATCDPRKGGSPSGY